MHWRQWIKFAFNYLFNVCFAHFQEDIEHELFSGRLKLWDRLSYFSNYCNFIHLFRNHQGELPTVWTAILRMKHVSLSKGPHPSTKSITWNVFAIRMLDHEFMRAWPTLIIRIDHKGAYEVSKEWWSMPIYSEDRGSKSRTTCTPHHFNSEHQMSSIYWQVAFSSH